MAKPVLLVLLLLSQSAFAGDSQPSTAAPSTADDNERALEDGFGGPATPTKRDDLMADVPPPVFKEDESSTAEKQFSELLERTQALSSEHHLDEARQSADRLVSLASTLTPGARHQALELAASIADRARDTQAAKKFAEAWLKSCGPEETERCREQALLLLSRVSPDKERVAALRSADACANRANAAAAEHERKLPNCVPVAERTFRQERDNLMLAQLALDDALVTLRSEASATERSTQFAGVARLCEEPRCAEVAMAALGQVVSAELENGNPDAAARAAIRQTRIHASVLPSEEKLYARTEDSERACAAFDQQRGAGAYRKLEQQLLGSYAFQDFSRNRSVSDGLPSDQVRRVNEHFAVTLQECLTAAARKLPPGSSDVVHVGWTVLNDGRVDAVKVDRSPDRTAALQSCMAQKLSLWRYPKYRGEWQHVDQQFQLRGPAR